MIGQFLDEKDRRLYGAMVQADAAYHAALNQVTRDPQSTALQEAAVAAGRAKSAAEAAWYDYDPLEVLRDEA